MNKNIPAVSIIIPMYNVKNFVKESSSKLIGFNAGFGRMRNWIVQSSINSARSNFSAT